MVLGYDYSKGLLYLHLFFTSTVKKAKEVKVSLSFPVCRTQWEFNIKISPFHFICLWTCSSWLYTYWNITEILLCRLHFEYSFKLYYTMESYGLVYLGLVILLLKMLQWICNSIARVLWICKLKEIDRFGQFTCRE